MVCSYFQSEQIKSTTQWKKTVFTQIGWNSGETYGTIISFEGLDVTEGWLDKPRNWIIVRLTI